MVKFLKNLSYITLGVVLPTLASITGKFYIEKHLTFVESSMVAWTFIVILISISLVISCYALKRLSVVEKQNEELKALIVDLKSQSENNHYEVIDYMQNTREIFMGSGD